MLSRKEDLLEIIDKIKGANVLVVGDIILDRYIWGDVERISPEAPVPVVEVSREEDRLGGAGNVVSNLRAIGVDVSLCGFIGDDKEGKIVLELLESQGVTKEGILIDRRRPTCLKTRVIARAQQVVRIDREDRVTPQAEALSEGFAALVEAHLEQAQAVVLSDYGKGTVTRSLMKKFVEARNESRIGLHSRPFVVDPHPRNYDLYEAISVAKPNRKEAEVASGITITDKESAVRAAKTLIEKWQSEMMLITLGEDGLVIVSADGETEILLDTVAREVFDVSGAGDTVTALYSAAIAVGASQQVAGDLANIGAGVVVSEVGTVPITLAQLSCEIEHLASLQ